MITMRTAAQSRDYHDRTKTCAWVNYEIWTGIRRSLPAAYVGLLMEPGNKAFYDFSYVPGVKVMVSFASSYHKMDDPEERKSACRNIIEEGTDVIASDLPTEVGRARSGVANKAAARQHYLGSLAFGAGSQICSD